MKYEHMQESTKTTEAGFYYTDRWKIKMERPRKCGVCGNLTTSLDVTDEIPICSEECQWKRDIEVHGRTEWEEPV